MMLRTLVLLCVAASVAAAAALPSQARPAGACHVPHAMHRVTFIALSAHGISCEIATSYAQHVAANGTPPHGLTCTHQVHGRDVHWHCASTASARAHSFTVA